MPRATVFVFTVCFPSVSAVKSVQIHSTKYETNQQTLFSQQPPPLLTSGDSNIKLRHHEQSVRFYTLRKIRLNKNNPEHNGLLFFTSLIFALSIYLRFPFGGVIARIARPQISLVDVLASNPYRQSLLFSLATFSKFS